MSSRLSRSPKIEGLCSEWDECEDELEESEVPKDGEEIEEREESDKDKSELGWARASELERSSRNCVARCRL